MLILHKRNGTRKSPEADFLTHNQCFDIVFVCDCIYVVLGFRSLIGLKVCYFLVPSMLYVFVPPSELRSQRHCAEQQEQRVEWDWIGCG